MGPTERVIVLIDMDCFYCQVEEKLNPQLEGKPIAVVQYNTWRGGGIIAVNYPAREQGVTRHMRGNDAKKKCPNIKLVQVPEVRGKADLTKYRDAGKRVADVLSSFTPLIERASVDEAYLDITELVKKEMETDLINLTQSNLKNTFVEGWDIQEFLDLVRTNGDFHQSNLKLAIGGLITEKIRQEVYKKTGYKCSAGIAHNKILAKLVCSLHKPNKQTILPQEAVENFFETLPINKIKSLGGKFGQTLSEDLQIMYMGQLAKFSAKQLTQKYDEKTANWLYNVARGIDYEPVKTKLISKSIACCKNFSGKTALTTSEEVQHWLNELAEEISERLEKDLKENNRKAKQIVVSFTHEINKKEVNSSRTHPLTSYNSKKITQGAFYVIKKFCLRTDGSYNLKFLGLSASNFEDVKKVREITSYFQTGETCLKQKNSSTDKIKKYTSMMSNEKLIDITNKKLIDDNSSVYLQLTQDLQENMNGLVFYDDTYRITKKTIDFEVADKSEISFSNDSISEVLVNCLKNQIKPNVGTFVSSFFKNYFEQESNNTEVKKTNLEKVEFEKKIYIKVDPVKDLIENVEVCPKCKVEITASELLSHQDYHFALKLSSNEVNIPKENKTKVEYVRKALKRSAEVKNENLMDFFKKSSIENSSIGTEICLECNKKIKTSDISSHMDYHVAKKLYQEINPTGLSHSLPIKSTPKRKDKKFNKNSQNRSVTSFFKPL